MSQPKNSMVDMSYYMVALIIYVSITILQEHHFSLRNFDSYWCARIFHRSLRQSIQKKKL